MRHLRRGVSVEAVDGLVLLGRVGGGSICEVWRGRTADGRAVIVKQAPYDVEVEARGLALLRQHGAPVPAVLAVEGAILVLEEVGGPPDWAALGRALAALHRASALDPPRFGLDHDNRIGPLPQVNTWHDDWPSFFAERRLRPHLDALPVPLRRRLEPRLDRLGDLLPAQPRASLIHGDLWSGNIVAGRWLIDPAVAYCDRELELAFLRLFGGVPPELQAAYEAEWPLDAEFREREPLLQLYHLLVHVRLFGAGYHAALSERLDRLRW